MSQILQTVTIEPHIPAKACVIWLHGLGASGHDFVPIVPELGLNDNHAIRFIFPHAPLRPVSLNFNMKMPAWYDIYAIELHSKEDEPGIIQAAQSVHRIIEQQIDQGIKPNKIILMGFSQGGGLAIYSGLHCQHPLAGIGVLSGYLPLGECLLPANQVANGETPILLMHGTEDAVLPIVFAEISLQRLQQQGYKTEWKTYPMEHTVNLPQINEISEWIRNRLDV